MNRSRLLKGLLVVVVLLAVSAWAGLRWASGVTAETVSRAMETHRVTFPVPFPLTEGELVELGLEEDEGNRIAIERATERGRHLVDARYGCAECHGADFSGGVMVDDAVVGSFFGPNLTAGEGSRTAGYTASDWDRIVRHGIKPDGTPAVMPSTDFILMSDQELSDIVTYIRSRAPMFGETPAPAFGPLGKLLVASGEMLFSADLIEDHFAPHEVLPPAAAVTPEFGRHLVGVCTGCHGPDLRGGPIVGGDPSWPDALNLTPHEDGLADWTFEQFVTALRDGVKPDGTALREPMTFVMPFAAEMTDIELRAIWAYLQTLEPLADG